MRFQLFAARAGLAALLPACLGAAIAVVGVRLGFFPYQVGLELMVPAAAMGIIALICSLAWLASALKHNSGEGKRIGLVVLVGSLLLLWPPLHTLYRSATAPPLHDVSTDPDDAPHFVVLARSRTPGMNAPAYHGEARVTWRGKTATASYLMHTYYPKLTKPLALIMSPEHMFWRSFETAKKMGWHLVDWNEKEGRIEATDRSFWFGQVCDIVIRVRAAGTLGARLDLRAQSETGTLDFGGNIARLQAYRAKLNS